MANENTPVWVAVALGFLLGWIKRLAKFAWEDLWVELFRLVVQVEGELKGSPGLAKRDAVLAAATTWLANQGAMSGAEKFIIRLAITITVDGLVKNLNSGPAGHSWLEEAQKLHEHIEDLLPWLHDPPAPAVPPRVG